MYLKFSESFYSQQTLYFCSHLIDLVSNYLLDGQFCIRFGVVSPLFIYKMVNNQIRYKLDRSGGSYLIHEGCFIIQILLHRMFSRFGKKGSLVSWSRVMVCCSKPSFCQNDPSIVTRHTRFSELPTFRKYLLCTPNLFKANIPVSSCPLLIQGISWQIEQSNLALPRI